MAWKILSALTALCLVGSSFFAWKNTEILKNERAREAYTNKNKVAILEHKKAAEDSKARHTSNLAESTKELESTKIAVVEAAAKAQEKEQELATLKTTLEGTTKLVAELQKQIDEAGDIKQLLATVATLEKEKKEAEAALANQTQRFATAQETLTNLNETVKVTEEREARGRRGIVEPDFTARVTQSFPSWGFVLLSKGNGGGVFANANLEIKRGTDVIAKLRVRNVEQNSSVADLIPGSIAEGSSIRSGDLVVASAEQAKTAPAPNKGAAPAPVGGIPAPGGAPADPFGAPAGGMAPGAAPAPGAPADPFGAPSMAPAGTPAAPSAVDPFGATPKP